MARIRPNGRPNQAIWLAGVLLFTLAIYFPGLDSLFLLDDQANLKDLAGINTRGLGFYLYGSSAGPGGRPLALLSFALQYESWPANPFAFKLVNLLLHLVNGVLVFLLCRRLAGAAMMAESLHNRFATLVTAVWLLHPLQLTTVLYVVQRMTILSTLFMLVGMLIYLTGRQAYRVAPTRKNLLTTLAGVYLCILLAVLGKESGIMLALYILVLEFTVLADFPAGGTWRRYAVPAMLLPLAALLLYLFRDGAGLLSAYSIREFTPAQRLLTEANVLIDYLRLILLPVAGAFSVFHDDYPVATGLTEPALTWLSLLLLTVLFVSALVMRKRAVLFSFAILWFLAGHLLEATVVPLELYFEHRNYLPLFGPVLLLCALLFDLKQHLSDRRLLIAIFPVWPLLVLVVTMLEIGLWSNPQLQAQEWARRQPESRRAWNHLLNLHLITGNRDQATVALETLRRIDPEDMYPHIKLITMANCYERRALPREVWEELVRAAAMAGYSDAGTPGELDNLLYLQARGACPQLELDRLSVLVDVLISNPRFQPVRGRLYDVAANLAWLRREPGAALDYLDKGIAIVPDLDRLVFRLKIQVASGLYPEANAALQQIRDRLVTSPREQLFYREQLQTIELQLQQATGDG